MAPPSSICVLLPIMAFTTLRCSSTLWFGRPPIWYFVPASIMSNFIFDTTNASCDICLTDCFLMVVGGGKDSCKWSCSVYGKYKYFKASPKEQCFYRNSYNSTTKLLSLELLMRTNNQHRRYLNLYILGRDVAKCVNY